MENLDFATEILNNNGLTGLISLCFIALVFWIIKKFDNMQEKQYSIIETLSSELPLIRTSLDEIRKTIEDKKFEELENNMKMHYCCDECEEENLYQKKKKNS